LLADSKASPLALFGLSATVPQGHLKELTESESEVLDALRDFGIHAAHHCFEHCEPARLLEVGKSGIAAYRLIMEPMTSVLENDRRKAKEMAIFMARWQISGLVEKLPDFFQQLVERGDTETFAQICEAWRNPIPNSWQALVTLHWGIQYQPGAFEPSKLGLVSTENACRWPFAFWTDAALAAFLTKLCGGIVTKDMMRKFRKKHNLITPPLIMVRPGPVNSPDRWCSVPYRSSRTSEPGGG
jgi:hypothetical protein